MQSIDVILVWLLNLLNVNRLANNCRYRSSIWQHAWRAFGEPLAINKYRCNSRPFLHETLICTHLCAGRIRWLIENLRLTERDNRYKRCTRFQCNLHKTFTILHDKSIIAGSCVESLLCSAHDQTNLESVIKLHQLEESKVQSTKCKLTAFDVNPSALQHALLKFGFVNCPTILLRSADINPHANTNSRYSGTLK